MLNVQTEPPTYTASCVPACSPDKLYDFAASSKEMERKEHAERLAALQRQRRTELAAVVKAVDNEVRADLRERADPGG